jgi:hypothetical protein
MSWRSTSSSALAALLLAGCAPAGDSGAAEDPLNAPEGTPLKISYFRAYPEPKTKKLEPTYKAVMSSTWRERIGESPRDPLEKAAPGQLYRGFLSDVELGKYHRLLQSYGIEKLRFQETDGLNPQLMNRLSLDPTKTSFTRVITIATDKKSRSYYYPDQQTSGDVELIKIFVKCEAFVLRIVEYSIRVGVSTPNRVIPTTPK